MVSWISIRSHLNCRPIHAPEKEMKFQNLVEIKGVRHAKVPWMINIFELGTDEHIELFMWLRAFIAQTQRRNYQGHALPLN